MNLFSIEGNIGSGKSSLITFISPLLEERNIHLLQEPIDIWRNCNGINLLNVFYSDPSRYCYMFQSYALISRMMYLENNQNQNNSNNQDQNQNQYQNQNQNNNNNNDNITKNIKLIERSILSDKCFADNCYENNMMNEYEYQAYLTWYNYLISKFQCRPKGIIYLRTTPEICYERMKKRDREEEKSVTFDYLYNLHKKHDEWLLHKNQYSEEIENSETKNCSLLNSLSLFVDNRYNIPVLVLNGDVEFSNDKNELNLLCNRIIEFIEKITITNKI